MKRRPEGAPLVDLWVATLQARAMVRRGARERGLKVTRREVRRVVADRIQKALRA